MNLFQQIDFSMHVPTHSSWTYSDQVEVYQLFPWSSLWFVAVVHPVRILSQSRSAEASCILLSLRARFLDILLKVYSCRATFEAIPVPLDQAFSVCNGFEDRYKR